MTAQPLWTSREIAAATGGTVVTPFTVSGVTFDSRAVMPGDLFLALDGETTDGHRFVVQALASGASAALVSHRPDGVAEDAPLIVVGDTTRALWDLAAASRARMTGTVIGVTGSVGKTGTKEALKAALAANGLTHASAASFNNHVGVPLSLARMPRDTVYGVFELGMNHPGELGPLSRLVRPQIAIITTIEPAHTAFFPSTEAIADAKAEIFLGVVPGGTVILNRDNRYFGRLAAAAAALDLKVVAFGSEAPADVRLCGLALKPDLTVVDADIMGTRATYKIAAPGRHWAMNSLAIMAAVDLAGADLFAASTALAALEPMAGRGKRSTLRLAKGGCFTLVDESYNASPSAMRAAFANLKLSEPGPRGRRIAVLGDMRELGDDADALHAALAPDLIASGVDLVFTCGSHMTALAVTLPDEIKGGHTDDSRKLAPVVAAEIRNQDVVLVKGSLGSYMAAIVGKLQDLDSAETNTEVSGYVRP